MSYSALTRRYFEHAPGAGRLEGAYRGTAGRPEEGTWVQFDLAVDAEGRRIERARFLAFGCPHVIAVAAWVAEQSTGHLLQTRLPETVEALRARFEAPVEKLGRLLVIEDAYLAAVAQASAARAAEAVQPTQPSQAIQGTGDARVPRSTSGGRPVSSGDDEPAPRGSH